MKKVKLSSIEKNGWKIKPEDRDKIATRKISLNLDEAVRSIAGNLEKISNSFGKFDSREVADNSDIIAALRIQTKALTRLADQIKKTEPPKPMVAPEPWKEITVDFERGLDRMIKNPITIKRVK